MTKDTVMFSAYVIYRRLMEDDPVPVPEPDLDPDFDPDFDPKADLDAYIQGKTEIRGGYSTDLFQRLKSKLKGRKRAKLDNNTYAEDNTNLFYDKYIGVRFHATEIIKAYDDGKVVVDVRGFETRTTLVRLNDWLCSGWKIYQKDFTWYWYNHTTGAGYNLDNYVYPFSNNDTILPDGSLKLTAERKLIKSRKLR